MTEACIVFVDFFPSSFALGLDFWGRDRRDFAPVSMGAGGL